MSYINLPSGPGFNKAVISFWFRVPQESITEAANARTGQDGAMLDGIVPLVVMGQEGTGQTPSNTEETHNVKDSEYSGTSHGSGLATITWECTSAVEIYPGSGPLCCIESIITHTYECTSIFFSGETANGTTYKTTPTGPGPKTNPTFIGVDTSGGRSTLYVNFESAQKPSVSNYAYELTSITPVSDMGGEIGTCTSGTTSFGCNVLCCVCLLIECSNSVDNGHGSSNLTTTGGDSPGTQQPREDHYTEIPFALDETGAIHNDVSKIDVAADEWHHVLVSVDLKTVASHGYAEDEDTSEPVGKKIDSAARLYIALDDKNYTKYDLSDNWAEGKGDNDVVTAGALKAIRGGPPRGSGIGGISHYSLASSAVPGGAIGMPATDKYVKNIYRVEMAEFQMWTGATLDTGVQTNRRAFLDYKRDEKGKVVPGKDGSRKLKPVDPKKAAKLMGKKPDILLHGSSRWKKGDNTGPGGDFDPKGGIESYKPDPVLGG